MNTIVDNLWYIDGQYGKFAKRYMHGKAPAIPDLFVHFNKGSESNSGGYNDWVAKRIKAPQKEKKVLMEHENRLITVISHPCLSISQWSQVRNTTEDLTKTLCTYADDMEQSVKQSEERHKSTTPCCSHNTDTQSRLIPASKLPTKPLYL